VLGGQAGCRQCVELLKVVDGGIAVGEALLELVVVRFQPGDLGVAGIGGGPAGLQSGEAVLEFLVQVRVGARLAGRRARVRGCGAASAR
jgi:hypothetical protein